MLIHEAAALAHEFDAVMTRRAWPAVIKIRPTDSEECCIICKPGGKKTPRWQPKLVDLIADDWIVTRAGMNEVSQGS